MNELKKVSHIVKAILEEDKQTRNSDSYLYLKVLDHYANQKNIHLSAMPVPYFLANINDLGFPGFETVRRSRQKIQATHPELSACAEVEAMRFVNEKAFREYARGVES